jgi:hypothetical protein
MISQEIYEAERNRRLQLEEECDLLSKEVVRLTEIIDELSNAKPPKTEREDVGWIDGDCLYPNSIEKVFPNACNGKNVIAVNFGFFEQVLVSAGSDNSLHIYDLRNFDELCHWTQLFSSPVTCINSFSNITACSLVDGTLLLVSFFFSALFI